jgi:hypothetical protein
VSIAQPKTTARNPISDVTPGEALFNQHTRAQLNRWTLGKSTALAG